MDVFSKKLKLNIRSFNYDKKGGSKELNRPSIDRIDNSLGYTADNIIITSLAYNVMKNQLDIKDLVTHCKAIITFYEER